MRHLWSQENGIERAERRQEWPLQLEAIKEVGLHVLCLCSELRQVAKPVAKLSPRQSHKQTPGNHNPSLDFTLFLVVFTSLLWALELGNPVTRPVSLHSQEFQFQVAASAFVSPAFPSFPPEQGGPAVCV